MLFVLLLVLHSSMDLLQCSYACFSFSVVLASQWLQHLLEHNGRTVQESCILFLLRTKTIYNFLKT